MRQVEAEHMQLHPYAADDANAFAEVDLRMSRRMGQRHEDLARPAAGDPNVILHYGITAGKTVFEPQPFENPLRGVPLLRRCRLVGLQDRVDDRYEQSELRPLRRLGSHITGRRRIAAHLGNRVSAQSENPRRLAPALPFDEDKPSNRCVNLHREHPRPSLFESDFEKVRPRKWPGFTPPRATALCRRSVAYYCTAAYRQVRASEIAIAAASTDAWDEYFLALTAGTGMRIYFSHGIPVLSTWDGQRCAALADVLLRGLSEARVRRLVSLCAGGGGALEQLPQNWLALLPRGARPPERDNPADRLASCN